MSRSMPVRANAVFVTRSEWDSGTLTAIGGFIVAIVTAIFGGGFWQWKAGRKKVDADAQTAMVNGFISLNTQSQARIDRLEQVNQELEAENQKHGRRIARIERLLVQHNIDFPSEEP